MVSCFALYLGIARDASGQAVFVDGRSLKIASLGSWDMYSLARRGWVIGMQCMTLLILKQLRSASYTVRVRAMVLRILVVLFCFLFYCSFRSFVKVFL